MQLGDTLLNWLENMTYWQCSVINSCIKGKKGYGGLKSTNNVIYVQV